MTEKEKMIELLDEVHKKPLGKEYRERLGNIADHLIANGVTFREDAHWATEQAYKNGYEDGVKSVTDNNVGGKWISVKDRLPTLDESVLIFSVRSFIKTHYNEVWSLFRRHGGELIWVDKYGDGHKLTEVTHWMPLPEPPKGE